MKIRAALLNVSLMLALAVPAWGSLVWVNPAADLHPTLTDKTAVAHFNFKNTGSQPVTITSVHPSCGCTTAALPKNVVAPGESGEITATFNIGDRAGVQSKTIRVTTDDPQKPDMILKLTATIPKLLEVSPIFLYWKPGEPLTPKTLSVKVGAEFPVTKLDVSTSDPAFAAELAAPTPNDKTFQITVTPKDGSRPINGSVKIQPDFPKDGGKTFYANVRVDRLGSVRPASVPQIIHPGAARKTPEPSTTPESSTTPAPSTTPESSKTPE